MFIEVEGQLTLPNNNIYPNADTAVIGIANIGIMAFLAVHNIVLILLKLRLSIMMLIL